MSDLGTCTGCLGSVARLLAFSGLDLSLWFGVGQKVSHWERLIRVWSCLCWTEISSVGVLEFCLEEMKSDVWKGHSRGGQVMILYDSLFGILLERNVRSRV